VKSHENQGKQFRRLDDAPVFDMKRKQEPTQASNSKSSLQLVLISDTHGLHREGLDLLLGALPRVTRLCHQPGYPTDQHISALADDGDSHRIARGAKW
jgi:hypothetical protein